MGKGILLELKGREAVVLTSQGEFKRVSVPSGAWGVGDEVDFSETRAVPWARWGLTAAAAVLMLLAPVGYQSWALAQPVALVTVDINPSLRLTLNKNEQVLTAEGLNRDGVAVLQGVEWKRRPVGDVVAEITARAIAANKLNIDDESSAVVVAVAPAKQKELSQQQYEAIAADTRSAIEAEVQHEGKARNVAPKTNVPVLRATVQEKMEAEAKGLTSGQYLVWQEIQQKLPDVQPDQFKELGPGKLLKALHVNPSSIFNQAEEHHGSQGRKGGKKGAVEAPEPAQPTAVKPGEGNSDKGKPEEATGAQSNKPDEMGRPDDNKGKPDEKGKPDDRGKGNDKGKADDKQNAEQGKKGGKKSSTNDTWKLPFLPVEIPKPSFMRDTEKHADHEKDGPRAQTPGAGAPPESGDKPNGSGESNGNGDGNGRGQGSSDRGRNGGSAGGNGGGNGSGNGGRR